MKTVKDVMDQYYIEARSRLIDVAAILDRCDRMAAGQGNGRPANDPRRENLARLIEILHEPSSHPDRAERMLKLLSLPYAPV